MERGRLKPNSPHLAPEPVAAASRTQSSFFPWACRVNHNTQQRPWGGGQAGESSPSRVLCLLLRLCVSGSDDLQHPPSKTLLTNLHISRAGGSLTLVYCSMPAIISALPGCNGPMRGLLLQLHYPGSLLLPGLLLCLERRLPPLLLFLQLIFTLDECPLILGLIEAKELSKPLQPSQNRRLLAPWAERVLRDQATPPQPRTSSSQPAATFTRPQRPALWSTPPEGGCCADHAAPSVCWRGESATSEQQL